VGKTTLSTAKYLFNILLSDPKLNKYQKNFNSLDWSSTKAINKAFKNLLTTIDKELLSTETSDAI
jgi:hypothetical protein